MDVALDSNVFRNSQLLKSLNNYPYNLYISSIVELEQSFYYRMKGKIALWEGIHRGLDLQVIPVTKTEARIAAEYAQYFLNKPRTASSRFRDCLIAACSSTYEISIVTDNVRDFEYLPPRKVVTTEKMLKLVSGDNYSEYGSKQG